MAVWGMIVWGSMSEACTGFYDTAYPDLFLLFKINVVLLAMTFFMFLCVIVSSLHPLDYFRTGDLMTVVLVVSAHSEVWISFVRV